MALGARVAEQLEELKPRYNVAPSTSIPIIIQEREAGGFVVLLARWGFIPYWWKDPEYPRFSTINARVEDAAEKPVWRDAFAKSRCLIPATHWYEWLEERGVKTPFAHGSHDGMGFMFAGLWSRWRAHATDKPLWTAAMLTREASESVGHVHNRMPVILHPDAWRSWLDPALDTGAAVRTLIDTYSVGEARTWKISREVNDARNDSPDILVPLD